MGMTLENFRNSARKNSNLDQFDLEAMNEGRAIRTIRTSTPKRTKRYEKEFKLKPFNN